MKKFMNEKIQIKNKLSSYTMHSYDSYLSQKDLSLNISQEPPATVLQERFKRKMDTVMETTKSVLAPITTVSDIINITACPGTLWLDESKFPGFRTFQPESVPLFSCFEAYIPKASQHRL
jgi:hypothetical protein